MELSKAILAEFIGGDLEVQNGGEGYLYRGPIKDITLDGDTVRVEFEWFAKNDGGPKQPTMTWTSVEPKPYEASTRIYSAMESDGRIILQSSIVGEITVLFPPGGSKLDPARVSGLTKMETVTFKGGLTVEVDTEACSDFGFEAGDKVAPEGQTTPATVVGVAPVPEGMRCDCHQGGDEKLLWVRAEDGDVCFVPSFMVASLRKIG